MTPTIGSLCTGYAGLDLAVERLTGGKTAWLCEYEDAPSRLLAHHFPGVTNWHDVKDLRWADHPVTILTAGWPCQPFSGAGLRLGTEDERHLFPWIAQGLERMRPPIFLGENVRNHLNLGFDVVLAELDRIGYDVRWTVLPASAVGAPHRRERLWVVAVDRQVGGWDRPTGEPSATLHKGTWVDPSPGLFGYHEAGGIGTAGTMVGGERWDRVAADLTTDAAALLKTPTAQLAINGGSQHPDKRKAGGHGPTLADELEHLLPDAVQQRLLATPTVAAAVGGAPQDSKGKRDLRLDVPLLPTPTTTQRGPDANADTRPGAGPNLHNSVEQLPLDWGPYAAAVARWEALTRPAPAPTTWGRTGARLSPAFVEWMQGLAAGWVTEVPGLSKQDQLKLLGNGVVPQCASMAYGLLDVREVLARLGY